MTPFLPYGLTLEPVTGGYAIYEPSDRSITGQITLPVFTGSEIDFVDLEVPSNGRFSQEDLRLLWESGAELTAWREARVAIARDTGTFGAPEVIGLSKEMHDWRSLEQCAHDAAALLTRWPSQLDRRITRLPVGVPGGVDDLPLTELDAEEQGYVVQHDHKPGVTQSVRWIGHRRGLRSTAVSAMAYAVIETVRRSLPREQWRMVKTLINPIAVVAELAATPIGHRDPDASSWPAPFVTFVASSTRAIADLQSAQRGRGVVPLLDTDELYEAWLAIKVRDALDFHAGRRVKTDSDAIGAWQNDDILYELWVKPGVNRKGREFGGATFVALVADLLQPDVVLSASRDDETALFILDAKSWAFMAPEDALSQSAKYLYGIRRAKDLGQVPAVAGVDLVTCANPPVVPHTDTSRIRVLGATPTVGVEVLHQRLGQIMQLLVTEIESREIAASTY